MSDSSVPWTVACQSPLSMAFLRQEYWSGVAISFSKASSQSVNGTHISFLAGGFFTTESCFNCYWYYCLYFNFQTLFFQLQDMHILHDFFNSILSLQLRIPSSLAIQLSPSITIWFVQLLWCMQDSYWLK